MFVEVQAGIMVSKAAGIFCLLACTLASPATNAEPVYGVKGHNITLEPEVLNVHVKSIEWALNNTVIVHWDGDESDFHRNLLLDSEDLRKFQKNDSGLYTFVVNHTETGVSYLLTVRDTMLELWITKQCNSTTCTLNCTGVNNENPQVSWTDNKGGKESGPVWVVERSEHLDVIYTCTTVSESWKTKSISEKELFSDSSVSGKTSNLGKSMGTLVAVLVAVAVVVFAVYRTKRGQMVWPCLHGCHQQTKC
ncbi:uncharacterized protein LOC121695522 isoform X2 [Alosa sapidissima]|uniref:uncharacterized protein LOC121695522 isoform X2 n=1 Tax=Alosa sapidissima TaxID=34773 RepID=UPI001C09F807|nr:uncharacterized protein LOC121695522 isoform X2 [Alosa sapidissima]